MKLCNLYLSKNTLTKFPGVVTVEERTMRSEELERERSEPKKKKKMKGMRVNWIFFLSDAD